MNPYKQLRGSPPMTKNDRNGSSRGFGSLGRGLSAGGYQCRERKLDQLGGNFRQTLIMTVRPAIFDSGILPWNIAGFAQTPQKSRRVWLRVIRGSTAHETDQQQGCLRTHSERPRGG